MAGPLIEMLQGLRARRQRRRSGWGGGDAPAMRDMINPLDSQDMTDRAQGVDISSSMPATRLEARISEPVAESFVTSQLPQPAASSTVAAPQEEVPQRRSPFMTAAGSNAAASPMSSSQCGPGGCPVGPSRGLDPSQYGITLEPGQTLIRVGPDVSSGAAAPAQPQQAGQAAPTVAGAAPAQAAFDPNSAFSAWQGFMQNAAANPKDTNWMAAGLAAAQQADSFWKLHTQTANPSWKLYYGQQFVYWQKQSANSFMAHQLAQNLGPRQQMAQEAMQRGTPGYELTQAERLLANPSAAGDPEGRAAYYARTVNPKLTPEEIPNDPNFQHGRRVAYGANIAYGAAMAASADDRFYPWGDDDSRAGGVAAGWNPARKYYGGMKLEDAQAEIDAHFKPQYINFLSQANALRPPEKRLSEGELRDTADQHILALNTILAYDKDPNIGREQPAQSPSQQSAPAPAQPPAKQEDYGWFSHPQSGKWSAVW